MHGKTDMDRILCVVPEAQLERRIAEFDCLRRLNWDRFRMVAALTFLVAKRSRNTSWS
jgi:hypothetical protein